MKTDVIKAVVYRRNGLITRECKVHLEKGLNTIELEGLSKSANEDTLKINLESLKYSNLQVKNLQKTELIGKVQVDIKEIEALKNKILVKEQQKALWSKNSDFTQREKVDYAEMEKFINNYSDNVLALDEEIVKLQLDLTQKTEAYNKQFRKIDRKVIIFDVNSPDERDELIQFSYIEPYVAWDPVYEIYAEDDNDKLKVLLKGRVLQNTGEVWKDIELILFTGNPSITQNLPSIYTSWINFYDYSKERRIGSSSLDLLESEASLEMSSATKQSKNRAMGILKNSLDVMEDYDNIIKTEEETTTQYELPGVWSILNDGKGLLVDLYDYDIPANINRLLIPKSNPNGYLVAEVDSNKLNELDNQNVIIYYNDNYIGKATIHVDRNKDTTLLSLGIDENLLGLRVKEQFHSNNLAKQKDSIKIKLTISSANKRKVNVIVKDTLPKSRNKEVLVENTKLEGGVLDDENIIRWDLSLEPKSTKEITLSYDISYPKKGNIDIY